MVLSLERCPLFRVSFIERFHCMYICWVSVMATMDFWRMTNEQKRLNKRSVFHSRHPSISSQCETVLRANSANCVASALDRCLAYRRCPEYSTQVTGAAEYSGVTTIEKLLSSYMSINPSATYIQFWCSVCRLREMPHT